MSHMTTRRFATYTPYINRYRHIYSRIIVSWHLLFPSDSLVTTPSHHLTCATLAYTLIILVIYQDIWSWSRVVIVVSCDWGRSGGGGQHFASQRCWDGWKEGSQWGGGQSTTDIWCHHCKSVTKLTSCRGHLDIGLWLIGLCRTGMGYTARADTAA